MQTRFREQSKWSLPQPAGAAAPTLNPQAGLVDSQTLAASIYGGQWSSIECAAASGSRPCRPAAPPRNPQGILRIRRNQPLQFMAVDFVARIGGSKCVQAPLTDSGQTSVGVWGSAKRSGASPSRGGQRRPGKPKNSGTQIYGSRIRVRPGGSRWQSALPTGSRWNRALPGRPTKITVDTSAEA